MTDAPKIDTQAPERVWLKPCDPCNAPDDYYVCHPLFLDGREVSYVKDDLRCQGCGGGLKRVSSQMVCVECGKADDFAALIASCADLSAAREAAAAQAMRKRCADMVEREGHSLHVAIRHAPLPDTTALDRLIAERVREAVEGVSKLFEGCASSLVPADYAQGYREALEHVLDAARASKEGRDG